MLDYKLNRNEQGMVHYLYKNDGKHPYVGYCKLESAEWMLRQGEVKVSDEYNGFPVTANGMYFFEAEVKGELPQSSTATVKFVELFNFINQERPQSPTMTVPSGMEPDDNAEIGADGLPMPAGTEKPKRKKRTKDIVCE